MEAIPAAEVVAAGVPVAAVPESIKTAVGMEVLGRQELLLVLTAIFEEVREEPEMVGLLREGLVVPMVDLVAQVVNGAAAEEVVAAAVPAARRRLAAVRKRRWSNWRARETPGGRGRMCACGFLL